MNSKILCDVPIYTIDKNAFLEKIKNETESRIEKCSQNGEMQSDLKRYIQRRMLEFANWKYNQMIGYIEIAIENKDVIFNLYLTDEKRHMYFSNIKKYIKFVPTTGLHFWTDDKSNEEIKEEIYTFLDMIKRDFVRTNNAYFDMSVFELLIKYVDLKKYIDE